MAAKYPNMIGTVSLKCCPRETLRITLLYNQTAHCHILYRSYQYPSTHSDTNKCPKLHRVDVSCWKEIVCVTSKICNLLQICNLSKILGCPKSVHQKSLPLVNYYIQWNTLNTGNYSINMYIQLTDQKRAKQSTEWL